MSVPDVQIEPTWKHALQGEFSQPYFGQLVQFLKAEKAAGQVVYPPGPFIFNAFGCTPLPLVKVVILGQDPYHGPGQAHGLCFSVQAGVPPPPSLQNIFAEQERDLCISQPGTGDLTPWARQGVLLLNTTLTVRAGQAASHQGRGWETFTDAVIRTLDAAHIGLVFLLWGSPARKKKELITPGRHYVLEAPHPSPLSAYRGFFGCSHFSKTNAILLEQGRHAIDWQL